MKGCGMLVDFYFIFVFEEQFAMFCSNVLSIEML